MQTIARTKMHFRLSLLDLDLTDDIEEFKNKGGFSRNRRGLRFALFRNLTKDRSSTRTIHSLLDKTKASRGFIVLLAVVLLLALLFACILPNLSVNKEVFVGVMTGHATVEEILTFVDEVEEYINLVIVSDLGITTNSSALYTVFDNLHDRGLYFIPFMSLLEYVNDTNFFQVAKQRWGKHFLGVYTFDEPGGKQIDLAEHRPVNNALNYTDAARKYVNAVAEQGLLWWASNFNVTGNFTIFTSDYALYWYDYVACYNTVLAQFGWNHSRQVDIALCRGAATTHNSDWGAIVTWTYTQPPYIESAEELYKDMVLAYDNGAKYIVVFNYPTNITKHGLLTQEHLDSVKKFWNYHKSKPQPRERTGETAYVLPKDYGYGFRGPNDKIWGLWESDTLSPIVWNELNQLVESHGSKLDVIYEDAKPETRQRYKQLFFWNGTTLITD